MKILSLRVFQRVLRVSHPAITGECVLLLLLLQFHGYVDFVLSIFLDLMKAEARRLDEEQLLMPTEEKRRGRVSIAHTFCSMFPPPCTMSVEALDLMISLFDRIDCVEMDAEEIALLLQVLRIYRQMKRVQAGGYIDRHGIQFLFYVLLLAAEILPLSSVPYSAVLHACISESKDALVKEACVVLLKKKLGVVDDAPSTPVERSGDTACRGGQVQRAVHLLQQSVSQLQVRAVSDGGGVRHVAVGEQGDVGGAESVSLRDVESQQVGLHAYRAEAGDGGAWRSE